MKYIRTKDGQIRSFDECYCDIGYIYQCINGIKIANTIEELCDFVDIQYQDGSWETYPYEEEFRIKLLFYKAKKVFYGIRTDKGLIYAAKMNEKGELKLL